MRSVVLTMIVTVAARAQGANALRPGDALRLRVFRESELSGEFTINERGTVTIPRLGDLAVVEWPADSIRPRLVRAMGLFLRDPVVEVVLLRRIAVTGAVLKPGLYPVDPTMTLDDVLALAGGPSPDGRRDVVELQRDGVGSSHALRGAQPATAAMLRSGDRLHVSQRNWFARNSWLVGTIIGAAATVIAVRAR